MFHLFFDYIGLFVEKLISSKLYNASKNKIYHTKLAFNLEICKSNSVNYQRLFNAETRGTCIIVNCSPPEELGKFFLDECDPSKLMYKLIEQLFEQRWLSFKGITTNPRRTRDSNPVPQKTRQASCRQATPLTKFGEVCGGTL